MRPTREWLSRYNNVFERIEGDKRSLQEMDEYFPKERSLKGSSRFGEEKPKFQDVTSANPKEDRRTYEFFVKRRFPMIEQNALVAVLNAGAYGAVMASEYNTRPLIPEILVSENQFALIRSRPSVAEIIKRDHVPDWVGNSAKPS